MKLEAFSLCSGSSGNCVLIAADGDAILLDGGRSCSYLSRAAASVGIDLGRVAAAFVTHEHRDHISALDAAVKKYTFPVHMTRASYNAVSAAESPALIASAILHPPLYEERVGAFLVKSFLTYHDSACSVGYVVSVGDAKIGLCTDTGRFTDSIADALSGCTHLILESNHDRDMLLHGSYPAFLKARIDSPRGHLSNEDAAALAGLLSADDITLYHISRENNTPELALCEVRGAVPPSTAIRAAEPDSPVRII